MWSVTSSLDYLRTLSHYEVICYALICCTLPSIFSFIYYFIELLYSVEGIRSSLMIGGVLVIPGIITCGLYISSINPHTSRFLPLFLSIICCFTLISTSLYGEITSPVTWVTLSLGGYLLLQLLYNPSLIPIDTRSSLVIRYTRRGSITSSHRYGISLIFTLVISMILTVLIRDESLVSRSQMMLYIVFVFVKFEFREILYSTVDIGLEWSDSISWSHLPPDLARGIVNRMITFKDYVAATGVNQDWRSARSCIGRIPQHPPPELMLSEPQLTDMRTLFSFYDHRRHRLRLSEVRGKRFWGSPYGWVVTLGPCYETQLVHLMTGVRINLPQVQGLAPQEEWFRLVDKFILLKDPTDESTFLVIAIFGPVDSLAFTRVRRGAAFNRRGEGQWVFVHNPENLKFKDVAHLNDQIYALCDNGKLVCFKPDAPSADMVQVIADHPRDVGAHRKIYLVESLGNLYGVFRNGFLDSKERRFETTSFFVYKFNLNASAWEEVTHLEGQAFFVGDGNSFSGRFPTNTIPRRSNCIFFTDDQWDWQKYPKILAFGGPKILAFGGHDVGVFDMASRDIKPLAFGKDKPCFYSRPTWVIRSPKLFGSHDVGVFDMASRDIRPLGKDKLHSCSQRIWRSARSCIGRVPQHPPPELMLSEPQLTDMRTLFSLCDHSRHRLQLSEVRGKRFWGSPHGWVVTLGPCYETQLVHLMTGERINLPQVQGLAPQEEWFRLVDKFILLKDPTDESKFLVIAISGPMNSLAYTRAALNRRGEDEWVVVANLENLKFKDVAYFNDQIYALCDNGKLVRFEPDAPSADMVQVIADHPRDVGAHRKIYLVESLGNLYGVFRNGFLDSIERTHWTTSFFVYKFNFNASAWEEMTNLEGQAFFVGDGNSFSWHDSTNAIPSRGNCIYFTDDQWDLQRTHAFGGHDVGVFHMASRDILPLEFGKDKPHFYSRPTWVMCSPKHLGSHDVGVFDMTSWGIPPLAFGKDKLHSCSQRIWRSARSCIGRVPQHPPPELMLSEPQLTDMRTLFSLCDHSRHRLQLSEVRGKRFGGSPHGWVVTLGPCYETQLVHLESSSSSSSSCVLEELEDDSSPVPMVKKKQSKPPDDVVSL